MAAANQNTCHKSLTMPKKQNKKIVNKLQPSIK